MTSAVGPWLDASVDISGACPAWPGSPGAELTRRRNLDAGDSTTDSELRLDVHCGTHVDAPAHFIAGAGTVESLELQAFIGPTLVIEILDRASITEGDIEELVPRGTARVLFRTANSERRLLRKSSFTPDFCALTAGAAHALASRPEVVLAGSDYLSIQLFNGDPVTHTSLMAQGIAILEGLDLADIPGGAYSLIAVPLKLSAAEAAPVRALLRAQERPHGPVEKGLPS